MRRTAGSRPRAALARGGDENLRQASPNLPPFSSGTTSGTGCSSSVSGSAAAVVDRHAATNWHAAARTAGASVASSATRAPAPGASGHVVANSAHVNLASGPAALASSLHALALRLRAAVPRQPREPKRGARGRPRPGPSVAGRRLAHRVQSVEAGIRERAPPRAERPRRLIRYPSPSVGVGSAPADRTARGQ